MFDAENTRSSAGRSALVLFSMLSACGSPVVSQTAPSVVSTSPADGAANVALNARVTVTFSDAMKADTLNLTTFTVATSAGVLLQGTVLYADHTATFWPARYFAANQTLTATIHPGALSAAGLAWAQKRTFTFTTGSTAAAGLAVELRTADDFVILAKSGVSTVPRSVVTGDVGVSPGAGTLLTGFSLTADATNTFSTSPQVLGRLYAADDAQPTPAKLTTAVADMELAFTDAAGRAPEVTELGAGNISGMTLAPGVYKWGTGLVLATDVTLDGNATGVWIFQVAQNLTLESGVRVNLTGGALARNVFWQVAGSVDLGTTSHCEGSVLTRTSANLRTGATLTGRLLAQTAVTIDAATVVEAAR